MIERSLSSRVHVTTVLTRTDDRRARLLLLLSMFAEGKTLANEDHTRMAMAGSLMWLWSHVLCMDDQDQQVSGGPGLAIVNGQVDGWLCLVP